MMKNLFLLALLFASGSADDSYRLPTMYKPLHYDLDLTVLQISPVARKSLTPKKISPCRLSPLVPILDYTALTSENNTFTGIAAITFTVTEETPVIQLHTDPTFINISSILLNSTAIDSTSYSINSTTQILNVTSSTNLTVGTYYVLNITYVGTLNTNAMNGFYKSSYNTTDAGTQYLVTTDFEPTDARKAFPCWDEPAYKATYNIVLTYPTGYSALANTRSIVNDTTTYSSSGLTRTYFDTSPNMSTYLVAFIISNFTGSEGDVLESNASCPQRVWSRPSEYDSRVFALNLTSKYIDVYNNYTNINYSTSLTKLDQVAIPDFASGAMENWGLITYRETALLYYENDTSDLYKNYIARVVAHELAHQWFGNLVTMKWWSEIFLNEGFATFFEYYTTNEILPEYELEKQFVIKEVQYALPEDASTTVKAIRANVSTPSEISSKFDTINYDKAGSILRMTQHFLGKDVFKSGLQTYLSTYKYQNVEPENLWSSFTGTNVPGNNLSLVMDNWINKAGFPLVNVEFISNATSNYLHISQQRFLYFGNDTSSAWYVPISYTTSVNTTAFENTSAMAWLTPTTNITINLSSGLSWVVLNNQQTGYYRVNYDTSLWSNLTSALKATNFSGIIEVNRAQIVDDAFNLARATKLNYTTVFNIVEFLKNDTSYIVWYPAFNGFNFMLQRVGLNTTIGAKIAEHILDLSASLRNSVPMNTTNSSNHMYSLNHQLANTWACKLGHNNSIVTAQQIFESYKKNGTKPDKNIRTVVYCNALRYSTNITVDWAFLWSAFENTTLAAEKMNIISGLGCTTNQTILKSYLEKTLTNNSGIRSQDYASLMSSVYTGSSVGVDVALDFLVSNFSSIQSRFTSLSGVINGIAKYITTDAQIKKLQTLASNSSLDSTVLTMLNSAITTANSSLQWVSLHKSELYSYYGIAEEDTESGGMTASPAILAVVSVILVNYLCF